MTRRRLSRGATVLLTVIIGVVSVALLGVVWFAAVLSGGFDNLLDLNRPKESDEKVVTAREQADLRVQEDTTALVAEIEATGLRASGRVGGEADWCEEGQHNWKIDDSYDLRCIVERTALLAGQAREARQQLDALVAVLARAGYQPAYLGGELDPQIGADGVVSERELGRGGTYVSGDHRVEVELLAEDSPAYRIPRSGGGRGTVLLDGRPLDPATSPGELLPAGRYGVWLTVSLVAFEE